MSELDLRAGQSPASRLSIQRYLDGALSTLAGDVRAGLCATPKWLPPKHFYDDRGSRLFDRICDTPEYYQTRTEQALLESVADDVVSRPGPTELVELGSGAARKTRVLLEAIERSKQSCRYVPFDVSESMLEQSAKGLLARFPWLKIRGIVGDYDRHLDKLPRGERRLFLFLGGTIGNFTHAQAVAFLKNLSRHMGDGDRLLLGTDLVKDPAVLHAAYNDAAGVTADFNKNVLSVINRELGANFDISAFTHVAFYDSERAQIEMHLESSQAQRVRIPRLDLELSFAPGERMRTEISRKFTRESVERLLAEAGLKLVRWHTPPDNFFGLSVSRRDSAA